MAGNQKILWLSKRISSWLKKISPCAKKKVQILFNFTVKGRVVSFKDSENHNNLWKLWFDFILEQLDKWRRAVMRKYKIDEDI